ncbi:hypothetical protein DAPPUDRAFT_322806 [Daphnia pulex]|uniref:Uncharacterized protein n=1 Tax=Daphnia pulex TaxID=6669 RepID=E9GX08_DAPPU|nr:hypothetical protein DAPPUDRAFT_322806 [Daphnia pulex]|eukprot:EFX76019.1 hypothetical protein DAPPUDRAFT_322806 [Daphnia pulex]
MEMEDEAAAPAYNLRPRPTLINADDVAFLATSKVLTVVHDVEKTTEPLPCSATPEQQKRFICTREEDLQPPGEEVDVEVVEEAIAEDIIRDWLCKPGIRESLVIPDSPESPEPENAEIRPPLPLKMKRRSGYTTQREFERMREEAGWSVSNPQTSPMVTVGRPARPESRKGRKEKLEPLHRRQTEDSFPRHLKQIRRVLLHLRETAAEARRNMDQIRRLIFDADVIENSMQHLVQEQILDTEDED